VGYNNSLTQTLWYAQIGGLSYDYINNIGTDSAGNVYVSGRSTDVSSTTVFNANGSTFAALPTSADTNNCNVVIIAKYNSSGTAQWATRIGGGTTQTVYTFSNGSTITDSAGNVYTAGYITSNATIYNSDGTTFGTLNTGTAGSVSFVVKHNSSGFAQWGATTSTVANTNDVFFNVAPDSAGNVCCVGFYKSSPNLLYNANGTLFGSLSNSCNISGYNFVGILVKYNSSGFVQWGARMDGNGGGAGQLDSVTTDSAGNIYVLGESSATTTTLYNAGGTAVYTTVSGPCTYVASYTSSGSGRWVARLTSMAANTYPGMCTDSAANVFVVGSFTVATLTIYNADASSAGTLANAGSGSGFIIKYNSSGVVQWKARISGPSLQIFYGVTTDSAGNVYATGIFNSTTITIYNADGTSFGTKNAVGLDGIVVKYNSAGVVQNAKQLPGTTSTVYSYCISLDSAGNIYLGGSFSSSGGTLTFN